jgi:putative flippase GtrA
MIMKAINIIKSFIPKLIIKHNTKVRFVLVGIWNTVFGYLVFFVFDTIFEKLFSERYFAYMSAMIIGQVIGTINAFIFHKFITFKSKIRGRGILTEFFRFCLTYIVTFLLSLALLPFFVETFKIEPKISAIIIILITTIISYLGHSKFSFK